MTVNGAVSKAVAKSGFAILLSPSAEPPGKLIISEGLVCHKNQPKIWMCVRACLLRPCRLLCNGTI